MQRAFHPLWKSYLWISIFTPTGYMRRYNSQNMYWFFAVLQLFYKNESWNLVEMHAVRHINEWNLYLNLMKGLIVDQWQQQRRQELNKGMLFCGHCKGSTCRLKLRVFPGSKGNCLCCAHRYRKRPIQPEACVFLLAFLIKICSHSTQKGIRKKFSEENFSYLLLCNKSWPLFL